MKTGLTYAAIAAAMGGLGYLDVGELVGLSLRVAAVVCVALAMGTIAGHLLIDEER